MSKAWPIAWIGLAECDPLVDEGVDYADKLRLPGVPVDLDIYRGVTTNSSRWAVPFPGIERPMPTQPALRQAFGMGRPVQRQ